MPSSLLCLRVKSSLYRKRYSLRIKSGHFLDHEALSIETVAFFFFFFSQSDHACTNEERVCSPQAERRWLFFPCRPGSSTQQLMSRRRSRSRFSCKHVSSTHFSSLSLFFFNSQWVQARCCLEADAAVTYVARQQAVVLLNCTSFLTSPKPEVIVLFFCSCQQACRDAACKEPLMQYF